MQGHPQLENGEFLKAGEASGFDAMVTCDQKEAMTSAKYPYLPGAKETRIESFRRGHDPLKSWGHVNLSYRRCLTSSIPIRTHCKPLYSLALRPVSISINTKHIAVRCGRIHTRHDRRRIILHDGPVIRPKHNQGDAPLREVLLILESDQR